MPGDPSWHKSPKSRTRASAPTLGAEVSRPRAVILALRSGAETPAWPPGHRASRRPSALGRRRQAIPRHLEFAQERARLLVRRIGGDGALGEQRGLLEIAAVLRDRRLAQVRFRAAH